MSDNKQTSRLRLQWLGMRPQGASGPPGHRISPAAILPTLQHGTGYTIDYILGRLIHTGLHIESHDLAREGVRKAVDLMEAEERVSISPDGKVSKLATRAAGSGYAHDNESDWSACRQ